MDFYADVGVMALGSRLRRLTERLAEDAARVLAVYGVPIEPRWFPVFLTLAKRSGLSATEIAAHIGQSRPAVSQVLKEMKARGLIEARPCAEDARAMRNALSPKGRAAIAAIHDQITDVTGAVDDILAGATHNIWRALGETEAALDAKGLFERVAEHRAAREREPIRIRPFQEGDEAAFKALNYAWVEEYFTLEQKDVDVLENFRAGILDAGGRILMADYEDRTVGTCALIPMADGGAELAKMGVDKSMRGVGVGWRLGRAAVEVAREMGATRLYLESNSALKPALHIYRKLGFEDVKGPPSPYARADVQMELRLA